MPVKKLTQPTIMRLKATDERQEIRDELTRGLHLIIQPLPTGTKSWALRFRRPDGKPAKLTLGSVDVSARKSADKPVIGGTLTLGEARVLAAQTDNERAGGKDVVGERKATVARNRIDAVERSANTFGACAREFLIEYRTRKHRQRPRRWREDAALLGLQYARGGDPATIEPKVIKGGLADIWRDKPVADIDGHDVHAIVSDARKLGSDSRARKLHAVVSAMFGWLQRERRVTANPVHGVWRPGPPVNRERVLTDAEIVAFWNACGRLDAGYGALFKLLLLTGCRLREVAGMKRSELVDDFWTIPGTRTKNHRPLAVPLPPQVVDIVDAVPVVAGSDLVFTAKGERPVNGFSRLKEQLDAAMDDIAGRKLPEWRLHDLRRTFVSGLAALGVQLPVIERLVNHISGSFGGVAGIYNRYQFDDEKRDALARWAQHIQGLIADRGNVVDLTKPARRRGRP